MISITRAYGKIKNVADLVELQKQADLYELQAIGVAEGSGALYILNKTTNTAVQILPEQAKELLGISDEQVSELISSRGTVEFEELSQEDSTIEIPEEIEEEHLDLVAGTEEFDKVESLISEKEEQESTFQKETMEDPLEDRKTVDEEKEPELVVDPIPEDCSVYKDKIALAKEVIHQKIGEIDDFKAYLQGLLNTLE
ncbi:MAG: hypothetical protein ABII85_00280 [Bacillota bacterium]